MRSLLVLPILIFMCCTAPLYIGQFNSIKSYHDPLDMTLIRTDSVTVKVYGRVVPYEKDSVFVVEKGGKKFVKFKSFSNLYEVKN